MGFSVLRKYPENKGFTPARTKNGALDTVALIRVGCVFDNSTLDEVPLIVTASKHSQYKFGHFGINFSDESAPTKESLEESELSKQPLDLEENFRYYLRSEEIFDKKLNDVTSLTEIVDNIYNEHVDTISGTRAVLFKLKLTAKNRLSEGLIPFILRIIKFLLGVFGKELSTSPASLIGVYEPYSFKNLETNYPYSFPFFKTDARISILSIVWISLSSILIWLYVPLIRLMNETFSLAIVLLGFIVFEYVVPIILLYSMNALIWTRLKLDTTSLKF